MNNYDFLPEDYIAPITSNLYMKFQEGENKFRILSKPIIGWEDWTTEKKPVRYRFNQKPSKSIDPNKPVKHFWSFIIWNYKDEQIQILHITQAGIRKSLEQYCRDEDWGAPFFYDIKVIKKGKEKETEYLVTALPHKPLREDVKHLFDKRKCYLEAIFDNEDPFALEWEKRTPGIFSEEDVMKSKVQPISSNKCTPGQAADLKDILSQCSEEYQKSVGSFLVKKNLTVFDLPVETYNMIHQKALKEAEKNRQVEE